jgi:uncharacterized RDD family membrane protein YckC
MKQKKLLKSILLEGMILIGIPLIIFSLHLIQRAFTDGPGAGGQAMPGLTIWGILSFLYSYFAIPSYIVISILLELFASSSLSHKILGLKIYNVDGSPVNIGKRIIRVLSKYGILGLLLILFFRFYNLAEFGIYNTLILTIILFYLIINLYLLNQKGQSLADLLASTIVLDKKKV